MYFVKDIKTRHPLYEGEHRDALEALRGYLAEDLKHYAKPVIQEVSAEKAQYVVVEMETRLSTFFTVEYALENPSAHPPSAEELFEAISARG